MQVSTCWTESQDLNKTLEILRDLALRQTRLAGEAGLELSRLIRRREWKAITLYEIDYNQDWDVVQLSAIRQALGYFTKLEDLDIGVDKEAEGFKTFLEGERACCSSNATFRALASGSVYVLYQYADPSDTRILHAARRFIARVLGRCPAIADLQLRFGPGATTTLKKSDSNPQNKMAGELSCSTSLWASGRIPELARSLPHWFDNHEVSYGIDEDDWLYSVVEVNTEPGRLEFVPKSAKTYRCIEKQPTLNTVFQAGLGKAIAQRLRHAGLDLSTNELNHTLARRGSIDGDVATIDLSNASDTISYELVRFLLPADWFEMLSAARCSSTLYRGVEYHLQKFSTMGNGFTFPLESLIFWSLVRSSVQSDELVTVYGDDIICASADYDRVVRTLTVCGFQVNKTKSFASGPFRESCGRDYYKGVNIRPYYQKHLVSGRTLFTLHNYFQRKYLLDEAASVRDLIPTPLRLYGPDGYGDGHLVSEVFPAKHVKKYQRRGYCGVFFETYSLCGRFIPNKYPGDYVTPLYVTYVKSHEEVWPSFSSKCESEKAWLRHLRMGTIFDQQFGVTENTAVDRLPNGRPLWPLPGDDDGRYQKKLIYTIGV